MNRRTRFGAAAGAALMAAALTAPAAAAGNDHVDVIVVYTDGVSNSSATTAAVARQHDVRPSHVYEHALEGFAGSVPEGRLHGLRNDPRVDYVELDQEVSIAAQALPTGIDRIFADDNANIDIDSTDDLRIDVDVAVIDTGIDLDHPDLNVAGSTNCLNHSGGPPFSRTYFCEGTGDDGNGHGTHVAGTIGAIDNGAGVVGVAPGARLYGVRVLDDNGSGSWSSVTAGIDWVTGHGGIEVANLSLGGGESAAVDDALSAAADAGVAIAVAAGNSDADVDGYGPAGHPKALTVSALADFNGLPGGGASPTCRTDEDDTFANFSNFGDTAGDDVDVIAPGVCILSTWNDGGTNTISGTSMASPHVAGALALLASGDGDPTSWSEVQAHYDTLLGAGNLDWDASQDPDGTKEPLLDVSDTAVFAPATVAGGGDGGGETNSPPEASFTYSCTDLNCNFDGTGSSDSDGSITSYDWDFGDGTFGSGSTVSHTYGAEGNYTVTLTLTDDDSATGTDSQVVSVSESGGTTDPTGVHVHDLETTSTNEGSTWGSTVTVSVRDADEQAVADRTVTFTYTSDRGASDSVSCITGTGGTCTTPVVSVHKNHSYVEYAVADISGDNVDPGSNHDVDGDSDGTTIRALKP